ncbi:death-on-curing family protein [Enterococcus devriesei]|uniref:Death-on-curing family protein n=1 Tax=Enterococcus devriesei TaxID=319970 RepID=A0A1L8STN9_9ENTE|nr:death-on-curing family protein [Enterococcus devriesei]
MKAEDIIKMNVYLIQTYSPKEILGVKDPKALDMIVNQPTLPAFGEEFYPKVPEKAAMLLIQIIKKHPFHNANKRTAFMALDIFLKLNGFSLTFTKEQILKLVVTIATYQGDFDLLKTNTTNQLQNHMKKQTS